MKFIYSVLISISIGIIWSIIALTLMCGKDVFIALSDDWNWLLAGAITGLIVGLFTIWSKIHQNEKYIFKDTIITYYLGIFIYWVCLGLNLERIIVAEWIGIHANISQQFGSSDHFSMLFIFLFYGTVFYGFFLILLTFLSREIVWMVYSRKKAKPIISGNSVQ